MPTAARVILIVLAVVLTGFVALSGLGVSRGLEPHRFSAITIAVWLAIGAVITSPLWVPASIPSTYPRLLRVARFLAVLVTLFPMWLLGGSVVTHNIQRALNGLGATPSALIQGLAVTFVWLLAVVVLLWPEIRTFRKHDAT